MRLTKTAIAVVLAIAVGSGIASARQSVRLDGEWECAYAAPGAPPGPEAGWYPVTVPSLLGSPPSGPHCLWYRRQFYVPPSWAGMRVVLVLEAVKYKHEVYLNGRSVGGHLGGYEATEYDVTDQVAVGKAHEVMVAVEDWTALVRENAKVGEPDPAAAFGSWVTDGIIAPIGPRGWEVGIWGSVFVEARSRVWVESVLVLPSVRQRTLRVEATIRNAGKSDERTLVTARVASGGPGPRIASKTVAVGAGEAQAVTLEAGWERPRLWSPEDPHLYSLVVGAQTGTMADSLEAHFGFREFAVEGDQFVLNGVPIHLLAATVSPISEYAADPRQVYETARAAGCVAVRLQGQPWPAQWYDAADETGMLLISESALGAPASSYALTDETLWANAREHVAAQVKSQRNHPSVVVWSGGNELLFSGGSEVEGVAEKLGGLADVIRALDPTRPVMFEGDGDPVGKADVINLHHPREASRWSLWPEAAHWLDGPVRLDSYPGTVWEWDRSKPLYLGESILASAEGEPAAIFFGDAAYVDEGAYRLQARAALWEMQVVAAREAGVSGICPGSLWQDGQPLRPLLEACTRAYRPTAAFTQEAGTSVFGGAVVERTLTVLNDTGRARALELRWRLAPTEGGWEVAGSAPVALGPAGRARVLAPLAVPAGEQAMQRAVFTVELWESGNQVFSDSRDWRVYGRRQLSGPVPGAPDRVAIYDPKGETTRLLEGLGIECLPLDPASVDRAFHWGKAAVVGKGAFGSGSGEDEWPAPELFEFVEEGGVLLVFEQHQYPASLIPLSLSDHDSAAVFPRCAGHPTVIGLESADWSHWLPDGVVARREIVKTARVGFLPLVDSGGPGGLETAGLVELRVGKGRMVLCQLDVTRKAGLDPAATKVLRNLLAYASTRPREARATAAICDEETARRLDAVGLRYTALEASPRLPSLQPYQALLVCDLAQVDGQTTLLREFVRRGGVVVLHDLAPAAVGTAERLIGEPLGVRAADGNPVRLIDGERPASGISNQDLNWSGLPTADLSAPPPSSSASYEVARPYRRVGEALKIEAESIAAETGLTYFDPTEAGTAVVMYANGELRTGIAVGRAEAHEIALRLRGTPAEGRYPQVNLRLDGLPARTVNVSSDEWRTCEFLVGLAPGQHTLGLAVADAFGVGEETRHLAVDWLTCTPVEFEPTGLRFHTDPGVLVSARSGRGLWVIDQVRWDADGGQQEQAARYLSSLLTNLGCEFGPAEKESAAAQAAGEAERRDE